MNVLALEPYYGGSHKAFLDGWSARSDHAWTALHLPAHTWKWRMRHAAVTFADDLRRRHDAGKRWDVIFATDMLNLAELRGLLPADLRTLPAVLYFHENQLTYPDTQRQDRDVHFALTNMTSALAADEVWFNSAFHREDFLTALACFLPRMPDHHLPWAPESIRSRSRIMHPGIDPPRPPGPRRPGPMRICWAHRWEHDKNPVVFFEAVEFLRQRGVDFRLSVIGQQFETVPAMFAAAEEMLAEQIDRWGFQQQRDDYLAALAEADVFVSTADHEFFGLSSVEAAAAGAFPLLPRRLAYPEVFAEAEGANDFFYDGTVGDLTDRLAELAHRLEADPPLAADADRARRAVQRYGWDELVPSYDQALARVASDAPHPKA
jgi:glycosyltransferase involved in cell wall biosynthesis